MVAWTTCIDIRRTQQLNHVSDVTRITSDLTQRPEGSTLPPFPSVGPVGGACHEVDSRPFRRRSHRLRRGIMHRTSLDGPGHHRLVGEAARWARRDPTPQAVRPRPLGVVAGRHHNRVAARAGGSVDAPRRPLGGEDGPRRLDGRARHGYSGWRPVDIGRRPVSGRRDTRLGARGERSRPGSGLLHPDRDGGAAAKRAQPGRASPAPRPNDRRACRPAARPTARPAARPAAAVPPPAARRAVQVAFTASLWSTGQIVSVPAVNAAGAGSASSIRIAMTQLQPSAPGQGARRQRRAPAPAAPCDRRPPCHRPPPGVVPTKAPALRRSDPTARPRRPTATRQAAAIRVGEVSERRRRARYGGSRPRGRGGGPAVTSGGAWQEPPSSSSSQWPSSSCSSAADLLNIAFWAGWYRAPAPPALHAQRAVAPR